MQKYASGQKTESVGASAFRRGVLVVFARRGILGSLERCKHSVSSSLFLALARLLGKLRDRRCAEQPREKRSGRIRSSRDPSEDPAFLEFNAMLT